MLAFLVSDSPLDGAAKLVDAAGKSNLAFAAFLVLILAFLGFKYFGQDVRWVRMAAYLVMIACIVFFIFVLVVPLPQKQAVNIPPAPGPTIKHCAGEHSEVFTFPGVLQRDSAGNYIDLGDGGGGTRFYKWACSWPAPATVTFVKCTVGRNQHVLAENKNGSTAECEGNINGGNDPITMQIAWDGPCDQQ